MKSNIKIQELIKFCWKNLLRQKNRVWLTVLGVAIGIASIITMVSLAIGLNKGIQSQIANNKSLLLIQVSAASIDDNSLSYERISELESINHVELASPVYIFPVIAQYGKYETTLNVRAISLEMMNALNLPIIEGALPEENDPLCLVAGRECGNGFYPIGQGVTVTADAVKSGPTSTVDIDLYSNTIFAIYDTDSYQRYLDGTISEIPQKFRIQTVATIGNNSGTQSSMYDHSIYVDLDAVESLFSKIFKNKVWPNQVIDSKRKRSTQFQYHEAYIIVDHLNNVQDVLNKLREKGYGTYSQMEYLISMQEQSKNAEFLLGAIGSISLLVSSIGIMNTMTMNVMERKKEIGIYKVIGCHLKLIRNIFLIESTIIGAIGGMAGVGLSLILSTIINYFADEISSLTIGLLFGAWCVSIIISAVSGLLPATKAMHMSPLEAIRYE